MSGPLMSHPRVRALKTAGEQEAVATLQNLLLRTDAEAEYSAGLFDDPGALIRYLRARHWNMQAAEDMIRCTARWRKAFGFEDLISGKLKAVVEVENATGKLYTRGFDRRGRPIFYMRPARENTFDPEGSLKHLVYCMERTVACIERRQTRLLEKCGEHFDDNGELGKLIVLADFRGYSLAQAINASTAREVLRIFQDHYPERLAQAFLIDPPWLFSSLWSVVQHFVDHDTKQKIQFVNDAPAKRRQRLASFFELSNLEEAVGGDAREPFDSHTYLNTKLGGTEFGLELAEQLALCGRGPSTASPRSSAATASPAWGASSAASSAAASSRSAWPTEASPACASPSRAASVPANFGAASTLRASPRSAKEDLRRWMSSSSPTSFGASTCGIYDEDDEALERVASLGAMYVRGFDREGRPIVYLRPWARGLPCKRDLLKYFVYCTERAIACADARAASGDARGQGRVMVVVDFQSYSVLSRPGIVTVFKALGILRRAYLDRLGLAVLVAPPRRIAASMRGVARALLGAEARQRFVVVDGAPEERAEALRRLIDPSVLEVGLGGENPSPFDTDVFLREPVAGEVFGSEFEAQLEARRRPECQAADPPKRGLIAAWLQRLLRPCPTRHSAAAASAATC